MQPDRAMADTTSGATSAARANILSVMPKSPTLTAFRSPPAKGTVPCFPALATEIRRQFVCRSVACLPQPLVKGNARAVSGRPAWHFVHLFNVMHVVVPNRFTLLGDMHLFDLV